jgi:hypothetical protein
MCIHITVVYQCPGFQPYINCGYTTRLRDVELCTGAIRWAQSLPVTSGHARNHNHGIFDITGIYPNLIIVGRPIQERRVTMSTSHRCIACRAAVNKHQEVRHELIKDNGKLLKELAPEVAHLSVQHPSSRDAIQRLMKVRLTDIWQSNQILMISLVSDNEIREAELREMQSREFGLTQIARNSISATTSRRRGGRHGRSRR